MYPYFFYLYVYPYFLTFISSRNSQGNYSFSRDVLLFICTYKLFARSSQFEGENKHDDSIVVVVVVVDHFFFFFFRLSLTTLSSPKAKNPAFFRKTA